MLLDEVAGLQDAHRDGAAPKIPAPSPPTPPPPVLRRPGSSWKYVPTPWTPINAEALVSAYRKKTPVYEFPGYDLAPAKEDAGWEDQWEDMGDGVLMYCTSAMPENPGVTFPIKREDSPQQFSSPSPVQPDTVISSENMDCSDGSTFAQSAYETTRAALEVKNFNHRVVKRQRKDKGTKPPLHIRQHLASFQHSPIDDTNESIFKTRYSILKPNNRHLDPRSGRIF
ncbi:hypothetical protein ANO14919_123070 [Xylariales sp. No.14919]|nr:hypothetical protein ANO14919_123070 [Xylariales sp. No.14919]